MNKDQIKKVNSFRRLSEIGGIMLGIGIGIFIIPSLVPADLDIKTIAVVLSLLGLAMLIYEQNSFNSFKK